MVNNKINNFYIKRGEFINLNRDVIDSLELTCKETGNPSYFKSPFIEGNQYLK